MDRVEFDAHAASAYFQALRAKFDDWLAVGPEIRVLKKTRCSAALVSAGVNLHRDF
jgi:quinol monooxygenase YgiN